MTFRLSLGQNRFAEPPRLRDGRPLLSAPRSCKRCCTRRPRHPTLVAPYPLDGCSAPSVAAAVALVPVVERLDVAGICTARRATGRLVYPRATAARALPANGQSGLPLLSRFFHRHAPARPARRGD
jgi:hypothetical protein